MVQARRKPGVLQRGNGTISSSRLRKIPSSATDSRWITVGNPLPAQTPKRRNSERGSENVIFQQPARDQTVTKSVGRAELCHPILAQQFRLGKDRERRLLLLIRWISVRTQDAFDDRAHLSTNALLDDWKNKNPFHRNGWTPVVSVTVGTRLQAPLRGNHVQGGRWNSLDTCPNAFCQTTAIRSLAGPSVGWTVILNTRLQPTNPAHRLARAINEGIYSKVPSQ